MRSSTGIGPSTRSLAPNDDGEKLIETSEKLIDSPSLLDLLRFQRLAQLDKKLTLPPQRLLHAGIDNRIEDSRHWGSKRGSKVCAAVNQTRD